MTGLSLIHFSAFAQNSAASSKQFEVIDFSLTAQHTHEWWQFPVEASFSHQASGTEITIRGFWNGGNNWVLCFSPTQPGTWTYATSSSDPGLNNVRGTLMATSPTTV